MSLLLFAETIILCINSSSLRGAKHCHTSTRWSAQKPRHEWVQAGKATSTKAGQGGRREGRERKGREGGGVKACVSCHSLLDPTNTPLVRWNTNPVFFNDVNPPDDYIWPLYVIKEHLQGPFSSLFLSFSCFRFILQSLPSTISPWTPHPSIICPSGPTSLYSYFFVPIFWLLLSSSSLFPFLAVQWWQI